MSRRKRIVNRNWKEVTSSVFDRSRNLFGDNADEGIRLAGKYAKLLDENHDGSRRNKAIAGVYLASKVLTCLIPQKRLAKEFGTTDVTIRKWVGLLIILIRKKDISGGIT